MLIPSIDLMGGRIVQLVQGETLRFSFDDFDYWIERFSKYPLVQLIDLDAAMRHKLIQLEFAEELKRALGEEALCFSVDTKHGKVAVRGWKDSVDLTPEEAITWLEDSCAAFLYTHVDTEGTMQGFPMEVAATLRSTTARQLIVAGGIRERREIEELDAMGVDAVAGMAVYSGAMEA